MEPPPFSAYSEESDSPGPMTDVDDPVSLEVSEEIENLPLQKLRSERLKELVPVEPTPANKAPLHPEIAKLVKEYAAVFPSSLPKGLPVARPNRSSDRPATRFQSARAQNLPYGPRRGSRTAEAAYLLHRSWTH